MKSTLPSLIAPCMVALALAAAALAGSARAQDAPAGLRLAQAETHRHVVIHDGAQSMNFVFDDGGPAMGAGRVVKGAPYCADAVHETVQWLADGNGGAANRIVRQQTTRLCRDGEGRTRQEVDRNGRKLVYLADPATRDNWVLDPERKTARRAGAGAAPALERGADADAMREHAQRMRDWARGVAERARAGAGAGAGATPPVPPPPVAPVPPMPPLPPLPPVPVVITRPDGGGAAGGRDVEINVVRLQSAGEPMPGAEWAMPPAVQWRAAALAPRGGGSVSPLGSKDVEGLRANGERTTWVIEAGRMGNDKPIQITRDIWTAPELVLTVSSRDFDPRSGEVNYRLRNVKRGEPDAALMRVPADYKQSGK